MEAAEEIDLILNSHELSGDEKNMLLASYWNDDLQDKTQHKEENTKENDVIPEKKDKFPSLSSTQQSKAKVALDPLIIDAILKSDLTWENKSVLVDIQLNEDASSSKDKADATSPQVELQGKTQDSEEKTTGGHGKFLNDGTSEKIDDSLSFHSPQQEAKENVDPGSELQLKQKSVNNVTANDQTLAEDDTSSNSSKNELEMSSLGTDQLLDIKARTQVATVDSCKIMLDDEVFTLSESVGNFDGKEGVLTIHKQEAACKYCHTLMVPESQVLKAICGCPSFYLIHNDCATAWSRELGDKCSYCEQEIKNIEVTLLFIPPKTSDETKPNSTSIRSWWCWCVC